MTDTAVSSGPIRATLIDISNCIGCRACQVACKQWNEREGEETELEADLGFQNPAVLSAKTYTLIAFHEMENPAKRGARSRSFTTLTRQAFVSCVPAPGSTASIVR